MFIIENNKTGWIFKNPLSAAFALCLVVGCMFFMPSKVINLRIQESIWPIIAIILFLSFVFADRIEPSIGILLFYLVFATVIRFTPSSWKILQVAGMYAAFYLIIVLLQLDQHKETVYNTLCCFALINILWVLLQKYGVNVLFYPKSGERILETGFFANKNELSVFLAIVAPCFLRKYWYWGLIAVGFGLIFAASYIGILATGIVLLIYAAVKVNETKMAVRNLIAVIVCVLAGFGAYWKWVDQPGYRTRLDVWKEAGELIKEKPLFGWGIGQTKYIFPLYTQTYSSKAIVPKLHNKVLDQDALKKVFLEKEIKGKSLAGGMWMELHNDYLQLWLEVGIVGLMLILGVFAAHVKSFVQSVNRDIIPVLCVTAACITAEGFFTWQIGRFTFLTVMMLAFIQADYLRKKGGTENAR